MSGREAGIAPRLPRDPDVWLRLGSFSVRRLLSGLVESRLPGPRGGRRLGSFGRFRRRASSLRPVRFCDDSRPRRRRPSTTEWVRLQVGIGPLFGGNCLWQEAFGIWSIGFVRRIRVSRRAFRGDRVDAVSPAGPHVDPGSIGFDRASILDGPKFRAEFWKRGVRWSRLGSFGGFSMVGECRARGRTLGRSRNGELPRSVGGVRARLPSLTLRPIRRLARTPSDRPWVGRRQPSARLRDGRRGGCDFQGAVAQFKVDSSGRRAWRVVGSTRRGTSNRRRPADRRDEGRSCVGCWFER
ncbi:hypothetical protein VT85_19300 [Planctomyces sp. SH-PL62]|nr:hypothetical protein VT85_19300 [Planctomyces sp. SH-PL62]